MAGPQNYTHAEVKAGLFLAFCLALFCGMLLVYGHLSKFWRGRQELHVVFSSAGGLSPDAPVLYNGVEVGRVKQMRIIHMDQQQLRRLVPVTRSGLDHLPLTASQRMELRRLPDEQFQEAVREALRDKTLIELTLEVLQEGQLRRYLTDDAVVLQTTVLGDVTIEIISGPGHGQTIAVDQKDTSPPLLLGVSGDFFARLARSVEQVREVLANVTDVVGGQERAAFKRASARLGGILDDMDSLTDTTNKRIGATSKRFDEVTKQGQKDVAAIRASLTASGKDLDRVKATVAAVRKDLSERMAGFQDVTSSLWKDWGAQLGAIKKDNDDAWAAAKPHLEQMKQHFRKLAENVMGVTTTSGNIGYFSGRAMEQSQPQMQRFARDMRISAKNMRDERLIYWREHVGEWATKGENGEHGYYTALETYRSLRRSTRWLHDAGIELGLLEPVVESAGPEGMTTLPLLRQTQEDIDQLHSSFAETRDEVSGTLLPSFTGVTGQELVPPFKRKCAARQVWPKR